MSGTCRVGKVVPNGIMVVSISVSYIRAGEKGKCVERREDA